MSLLALTWATGVGVRVEQGEGGEQGGEDCASMSCLLESKPDVFVGTKACKAL